MDISPIKNQRDYRKVLKAIEGLMSAKRNTPEGDRLDVLVTLVEAWERKHYPMDFPDPVAAIKYRSLALKMIWRLREGLAFPQSR
jgi:HTH-type transcriptional regulator / antitoxin HigA